MKNVFLFSVFLVLAKMGFTFAQESIWNEPTFPHHSIEIMTLDTGAQGDGAIIFFHGAGEYTGLKNIRPSIFIPWLEKGYKVAAISMPGFGASTGRKDFCGPFTMDSLNIAIDQIKEKLQVSKFSIIGFGQGGGAAVLLATKRSDITCIVSTNAAFDLLRHKVPGDPIMSVLQEKKYDLDTTDSRALQIRSPIYYVDSIQAPLFLLHRRGNPEVSELEVEEFYLKVRDAGKECRFVIREKTPEGEARKISFEEVMLEASDWIDDHMSGSND